MKPILLSEGFEGPGYENEGWIEIVDEGCSVTPDFQLETPPQIKGDYVLKSYSANNINERAKISYTLEEEQPRNVVSAWIKLAGHGLTNSKAIYAIELCTSNGTPKAIVEYYFIDYKINVLFKCVSDGQWIYGVDEVVPVPESEWLLVKFIYDLEGFEYKFKINNKTYGKGDLGSTYYSTNLKRLQVGISNNTSEYPATLYVANVEWDN